MNREALYKSLGLKIQEALVAAKVIDAPESGEAAFDPTLWLSFISGVVEIFRGCRNPATAREHIKEGSAVSYRYAVQLAKDEGYKGNERKRVAKELVAKGKTLTDEELDGIQKDAEDLPQPPPTAGGFWPMWIAILALLIPAAVYSQEKPTSFWPIDIEQNRRLDDHEERLKTLERARDSKASKEAEPTHANTGICNCKGSNKGVCYCLKSGVQCKCSKEVGSVWNLTPEGKPLGKTGEYANPDTGARVAKPVAAAVAQVAQPQYQWQYQVVCNGRRCTRQRVLVQVR